MSWISYEWEKLAHLLLETSPVFIHRLETFRFSYENEDIFRYFDHNKKLSEYLIRNRTN